jgi:hypothetical protein
MTRLVEFYVLWIGGTWTVERATLTGDGAGTEDDDCVALARARLESTLADNTRLETIGPLYYVAPFDVDQ